MECRRQYKNNNGGREERGEGTCVDRVGAGRMHANQTCVNQMGAGGEKLARRGGLVRVDCGVLGDRQLAVACGVDGETVRAEEHGLAYADGVHTNRETLGGGLGEALGDVEGRGYMCANREALGSEEWPVTAWDVDGEKAGTQGVVGRTVRAKAHGSMCAGDGERVAAQGKKGQGVLSGGAKGLGRQAQAAKQAKALGR